MKILKRSCLIIIGILTLVSCSDDFLNRAPLSSPSMETFWRTPEQAKMWVNNLYTLSDGSVSGWIGAHMIVDQEALSDNAFGRVTTAQNNIANGTFDTRDSKVLDAWEGCYRHIRLSLEFFENIDRIPDISQSDLDQLSGQVCFMLAYQYYLLMTRFRDVPLITKPLTIEESYVAVSSKVDVLEYILDQLDLAIGTLPVTWPASETGRVTKGAALFLKTRVLLYNGLWAEAAAAAKQVMDLNIYELHPKFDELFLTAFNNKKKEAILELQYAKNVLQHRLHDEFGPSVWNASTVILPLPELEESFEMKDGLSINESLLYDPENPFANRDPRYYETFLWHGQELNGQVLDLAGPEFGFGLTYLYFRKFIGDFKDRILFGYLNWNLFRYADLLLMYAEAKNEATGPDNSIYEALDLIRGRAGMPLVDRTRYSDKASLRSFIRNERRVELAGEGLRYNDIIRWRIAEQVLNIDVKSMDLENWIDCPLDKNGNPKLVERPIEKRVFNPAKHYVWPIPENAIERSNNLVQHAEWKN